MRELRLEASLSDLLAECFSHMSFLCCSWRKQGLKQAFLGLGASAKASFSDITPLAPSISFALRMSLLTGRGVWCLGRRRSWSRQRE